MTISWASSPRQADRPDASDVRRSGEVGIVPEQRGALDFDGFVHATGHRMHRAALLLCGGDHHLAEDLTQATYTKVFLAWNRVSRAEDPVAYTHAVLTRTYLSHRRLRRSGERPTETLPDRSQAPGADDVVRMDLRDALGQLSAQDRAVLVLRYWLDLDAARTAQILGIGEPAVRQRSRRALARLRQHVPDLDPDLPTSTPTSLGQEL